MTSCLNTATEMAVRRLYKQHGSQLDYFFNCNAVNLRQFRSPDELGNIQLGYCVGALVSIVPDTSLLDPGDDSEVRARFWSTARESARVFDERVRGDLQKFVNPQFVEFADRQLLIHVGLSNIGVLDPFHDDSFRIENLYFICNYPGGFDKILTEMIVCTVDGKLCCALSNNGYFFGPQLTDEFRDHFRRIIDIAAE